MMIIGTIVCIDLDESNPGCLDMAVERFNNLDVISVTGKSFDKYKNYKAGDKIEIEVEEKFISQVGTMLSAN
jgi:hypothetical protein